MTTVRLPTTAVPGPAIVDASLDGPLAELAGLIVARDAEATIAARVRRLQTVCDSVLVVDDASTDGTVAEAEAAGARVLKFPAPRGEGAGLKAAMRLARELGYIGGLWLGGQELAAADLKALAVGHKLAPEVLICGVGPGQALAGKEWDEAAAIARGEEPEPYPDYRPPKASGWTGAVERMFEELAETRYASPWGGPRVLPLQAMLRRPLLETGPGAHLEMLCRAVVAGVPTKELELSEAPIRPVYTCRKLALRLLARLGPTLAHRVALDKLGMGSGYAPPTTTPLVYVLGGVLIALSLSGCPRPPVPTAQLPACEQDLPRAAWPGGGDAQAALALLRASRESTSSVLVEQQVEVRDPDLQQNRKMKGMLALDGDDRLRLRLMAMGFTVLDYLELADRWQLTVPPARIARDGLVGEPVLDPADLPPEMAEAGSLQPELLGAMLRPLPADAQVRWQGGSCAVLEQLVGDAVVRTVEFGPSNGSWLAAREVLLAGGEVLLRAEHGDYKDVEPDGLWPWHTVLTQPARGTEIVLDTLRLRPDGATDAHFALLER